MNFSVLQFIIFIVLTIGLFSLLGVDLREQKISFVKSRIKSKRESLVGKELNFFEKLEYKLGGLLNKVGVSRNKFIIQVLFCFIGGLLLGNVIFSGLFLAFATGIVTVFIPYFVYTLRIQKLERKEADKLENIMSIITNAFISTNDIVKAVEIYINERNKFTDEPIVDPFSEFVTEVVMVNPNVTRALRILEIKINNYYFSEWIKVLIICQKDRSMKFALLPIIQAMNDKKTIQIESDTEMYQIWKDYFMLIGVMFMIVPMFKVLNEDWYNILTGTFGGKLCLLLMLILALITSLYVIKINKPIKS